MTREDLIYVFQGKYATAAELYRDMHLQPNEKEMLYETVVLFDAVRESFGRPIRINSGRRSLAKQEELRQGGARTAETSPHCYGVAIDVDVPDGLKDEDLAWLIDTAAGDLGLDPPRMGFRHYRQSNPDVHYPPGVSASFVHYDFTFLLPAELMATLPEKAQRAWPLKGLRW